jgi:hypothetical protein
LCLQLVYWLPVLLQDLQQFRILLYVTAAVGTSQQQRQHPGHQPALAEVDLDQSKVFG